jgi:outer membrane lipoprotein-sorting protein
MKTQNGELMLKIFIFLSLMTSASISFALNGNEIVSKSDQMRFVQTDVSFKVEVTDFKGSSTSKTQYKVYTKGPDVSRVETTFPERQSGRKLLMKGNDLWLFTPDIKRATRVSMQQRLTGEVANGDISKTHFSADYDAELLGEQKLNGVDTYHLSLKQKRDGVTYPSIEYWVKKAGFAPYQATFKTDGGKALKTAEYKEPKKYLNRMMITKIEIKSALNKEQKSVLTFSAYKKESLDDSFFNKETLSN